MAVAFVEAAGPPSGVNPPVGIRLPEGHLWPAMADEGVGDRLRRYRRLRKLSQGKLAELSGVSRTYIADLERGAILVPREPENLRALAKTLRVRLSELAQATGWYDGDDGLLTVEEAVAQHPGWDDDTKRALLKIIELADAQLAAAEVPERKR